MRHRARSPSLGVTRRARDAASCAVLVTRWSVGVTRRARDAASCGVVVTRSDQEGPRCGIVRGPRHAA